jgi:hypothetical protein
MVYGMGLAYPLNEAHVGDHCERVGAQPGMRMTLPFALLPSSKGEPAPEIQIDPAAFVFRMTERLTICFFL